jgi:hypothetical protein
MERQTTLDFLDNFGNYNTDDIEMDFNASLNLTVLTEDPSPTVQYDLSSLFQRSVQSFDPRLSDMRSSIVSVHRSFMAGGTTLRRATSTFRISDVTMADLLSGDIDFDCSFQE